MRGKPAHARSQRVPRAFDLVVTVLLLPIALLVGAVVAVVIVLDSPGGVLFAQTRVGKDGRHFRMLKFRKMRHAATGSPLTVADDERFTPIGRLLALTKLDELPQLWNVLRGDMRLVGPRPELPEFVARYRDGYDEILSVRPGITGPAAVAYASESHLLAAQLDPRSYYEEQLMPRKIAIDIDYVRRRSLLGDVKLLLATTAVPFVRVTLRVRSGSHPRYVAAAGAVIVLALASLIASGGA